MIFYRWHPEVAVRYLPVVREIKSLGEVTVLEVGSGGLGIAPYLGRPVTGLDVKFDPPFHPFLKRVEGKSTKMPFADKSFDVVIGIDVLEHMDKSDREKTIAEMKRVARKRVIVAVPVGNLAQRQDQQLSYEYQKIKGKKFPFLMDHEKYGLPERKEIKKLLGENVREEENESLALRKFLMRGWMAETFLAKLFYWKILLLFIWLFKFFERPPYYRVIFYADME